MFLATASCITEREKYTTRVCEVLRKADNLSPKEVKLSHQVMPLIPAKCLRGFRYVEKLQLTNCRMQEIEEFAFNDMESLRYLDLSHNLLTYLPEYLFENNKNLERVSLSGNKFSAVPYIAVPLFKLDVSRCKISGLNFTKTLQVQHLDISYNLLETLSSQDMQVLSRVSTIKLNNNKWKCNSEFHEMMCWSIKKTNASMREIPIRCTNEKRRFSYTFDIRLKLCEEAVIDVYSLPSYSLDRMAHKTSGNEIELTSHESMENSTNKNAISLWPIILIILTLHIITTFIILGAVMLVVKKIKMRKTAPSREVSISQSPLITESSEHIK